MVDKVSLAIHKCGYFYDFYSKCFHYADRTPVPDIKLGKMNQSQYQFSKWRLNCGVKLLSITLL